MCDIHFIEKNDHLKKNLLVYLSLTTICVVLFVMSFLVE
jgi:hypothetical protein